MTLAISVVFGDFFLLFRLYFYLFIIFCGEYDIVGIFMYIFVDMLVILDIWRMMCTSARYVYDHYLARPPPSSSSVTKQLCLRNRLRKEFLFYYHGDY